MAVGRSFEFHAAIKKNALAGVLFSIYPDLINAHPEYATTVCRHLTAITGIPLLTAPNLIEATQDVGSFVQLSGVLKRVAVKLSKTRLDDILQPAMLTQPRVLATVRE